MKTTQEKYEDQKAKASIDHLSQLIGKTVKSVCRDGGSDIGECFGLVFTDGTTAWLMADPEGNGPGHLEIDKP